MKYINLSKKRLVGRNNQPNTSLLTFDFDTQDDCSFTFINDQNQIIEIPSTGYYFAGSLGMMEPPSSLLFLSNDFTVEDNAITFNVDTYTSGYLSKIKKKNTQINVEIGLEDQNGKKVLLRDVGYASPRVLIEGIDPHEIIISGYATKEYVNAVVAGKQDLITEDSKVAWELISGAPEIPTELSSYATKDDITAAVSGLASEDYVDESVSGLASKEYVDEALSGVTVETVVISIPAEAETYTLQDRAFTHIPADNVTYTLPDVTDNKLHTVLVTVGFPTAVHTITFESSGSTITPLDLLTIGVGDVVEYLCRYDFVKASWVIACGRL